jgi:succinate dehydrogenase / fumarate reductase, membrane anchor subunit
MSFVTSPKFKYRYRGQNFERISWVFMRVSGLLMFFAVTFHLLYMHMVVGVENITFENIVERWTGPYGLIWRLFDMALLLLGMLHGYNGVRWVINDYVHHKGWNTVLRWTLYTVGSILIAAGLLVLFIGPGSLH